MAILRIPQADRVGLRLIKQLTPEAVRTLVVALANDPTHKPSVSAITLSDIEEIVDTLERLYQVSGYGEVPGEEFISDICDSLRENGELTATEEPVLRERLKQLLGIDALRIAAKATDLAQEYRHLYCDARILTDARPVYGTDPAQGPSAMVITHTLKIDYHEGAAMREIYLAIGSQDIAELRDVLNRAEAKAQSLRKLLESSKIRIIDPQL